jgi:hypothetical protein
VARPLQGGNVVASYGSLKLLPFCDPLRGDPSSEKIVASLAPKLQPAALTVAFDNPKCCAAPVNALGYERLT